MYISWDYNGNVTILKYHILRIIGLVWHIYHMIYLCVTFKVVP